MANHRFASRASVLKRSTMYFEALVNTAVHISRARHGKPEAVIAETFLQKMTNTTALLMGMLTDLLFETVELLRMFDTESMSNVPAPVA